MRFFQACSGGRTCAPDALRKGSSLFIVPGASPRVRENLVKRDFATWMRGIGWDVAQHPKAAHELRKLMGSRWFTELGAEVAQAWLGHKDISTTCRFCAALTRQPEPLPMDFGSRPHPLP